MMVVTNTGESQEIIGECHSLDSELGLYQAPGENEKDVVPYEQIATSVEKLGLKKNSIGMLSNGGRFYFDPSGPEYATPEVTTAEECVLRSFDGDEILFGAMNLLLQEGVIKSFQINRRNVDHNRSSRGVHINTATSLEDSDFSHWDIAELAALNVAKGALFGSGGLLLNVAGETHFHHSPRLSVTNQVDRSASSYSDRPLVRTSFKPDIGVRRLETVTSDALNFPWPMRASLVLTNAFVKLLEISPEQADIPHLVRPIQAAQTVGRFGNEKTVEADINEVKPVSLYPADILRGITETIFEAHEEVGYLDDESVQVLGEIIDVADLMSRDMRATAPYVESVARLVAMEAKMEKAGVTLDSETMCKFDYAWDWIGGGIAERIRKKKVAGWQGFSHTNSVHEQRKRLKTPPKNTRAYIRGNEIAQGRGEHVYTWYAMDKDDTTVTVHPLQTDFSNCYPE